MWQARHEFYHILLALIWAWTLRELWNEFNLTWIALSVLGSLLPDIEHFFYFFSYGKNHHYTQEVKRLARNRQWRLLSKFLSTGHKQNTFLVFHNFYFMLALVSVSLISSLVEWRFGVILFGAMLIHYIFDVFDDIFQLGIINPNWKRWGRHPH